MWIEEFVSHFKKSRVTAPRADQALALKEAHLRHSPSARRTPAPAQRVSGGLRTALFDLTRWSAKLMRTGRKQFNPAVVLLAMMHKYEDWKYEREWRFILTEPRLSEDRALPVPQPSRIFLGSRMPEDKKAELTGICTAKGIEVWQMERAPDAFALRSIRVG
jgi:hypothetical protein